MKNKRVTLNWREVMFLAGALSHAESHYNKMVELKINDSLTQHAEEDLRMLEEIKKKFGIKIGRVEEAA